MLVVLGYQLRTAIYALIGYVLVFKDACSRLDRVTARGRYICKQRHALHVLGLLLVSQILNEHLSASQEVLVTFTMQVPIPALRVPPVLHNFELIPILQDNALPFGAYPDNV